jgi:CheY-like chemotaxis protein
MTETGETTTYPNVLIVDDNKSYREAFRRNLQLEGYDVREAEDSEEAMVRLRESAMDVIVTDLSMRHPTEGLDLIRQARTLNPHLPIIMISAVGTFEEGAEASRLGARYVISKSKIDEEMENLFKAIDKAFTEYKKCMRYVDQLNGLRELAASEGGAAVQGALRQIIGSPDAPETVKGEAFDLLLEVGPQELVETTRQDLDRARNTALPSGDFFGQADKNLKAGLADFDSLDHDTQEALRTAEYLYVHTENVEHSVDFSRSIGFSYCFAVENEAKSRLRKRLQKFFGDSGTPKTIKSLLEDNGRSLSVFFHQYLLRLLRDINMDVTIDNVFQTFQRILEHGGKYKPDGLKALGIVLLCFGRAYGFKKFNKEVAVDNPLGMKGLENDKEVLHFATLLTNLQHYRNPYIHPEISEMEKLSKIRETTFECLNIAFKLV